VTQVLRYYAANTNVMLSGTVGYNGVYGDASGFLESSETTTYDADNRIAVLIQRNRKDGWAWGTSLASFSDASFRSNQSNNLGVFTEQQQVLYRLSNEVTSGYDAAGRLLTYRFMVQPSQNPGTNSYTHTYNYTYEGRDSYLEKTVVGTSSNTNFKSGSTTSFYDASGRRVAIEETDTSKRPTPQQRYFSYNGDGQIITRRDIGGTISNGAPQSPGGGEPMEYPENPVEHIIGFNEWRALSNGERAAIINGQKVRRYHYANGQQIAETSRGGMLEVTKFLTGFSSSESGTQTTPVQFGDTLQSIAQRVYGNSSLWYVLASANGLSNSELVEGTTLKVPEVRTNKNDSTTFKPYDPAEISGPTTPDLPFVAPPKPNNCGMMIVMIVAIVVTAIVAPYATNFVAGLLPAGTAAGIVTAVSTIGGAFIAGAAGSIASQVVGKAIGVIDHFSLKDAVVGGITNAVGAGLGKYLTTFDALTKGAKVVGQLNHVGRVLQGVGNYAGSIVANAAVGRDAKFSWAGVAAAAVGAGVSSVLGGSIPLLEGGASSGNFPQDFASGFVNGAVNASARRLFGFGKQDWGQIAMDAFGNALGGAIAGKVQGAINTASANRAERLGMGMSKAEYKAYQSQQRFNQVGQSLTNALGGYAFDPGNLDWAVENFGDSSRSYDFSTMEGIRSSLAGVDINDFPMVADNNYDDHTTFEGLVDFFGMKIANGVDQLLKPNYGKDSGLLSTAWNGLPSFKGFGNQGDDGIVLNAKAIELLRTNPTAQTAAELGLVDSFLAQGITDIESFGKLALALNPQVIALRGLGKGLEAIDPNNPYAKTILEYTQSDQLDNLLSLAKNLPAVILNAPENFKNWATVTATDAASAFNKGNYAEAFYHYGKILYPIVMGLVPVEGVALLGLEAVVKSVRPLVRAESVVARGAGAERAAEKAVAVRSTAYGDLVTNAKFLQKAGVTNPVLRRQIIEAGFDSSLLGPDTRITMARFNKLFVQTVEEGKAFSGRLGNIDTRVATINHAAVLERSGLLPRFEYPVFVANGEKRYVDLVGLSSETMQPTVLMQFVKENRTGVVIRPDELVAARQIEKTLNLNPGTVKLINTTRKK
jgi:hypothetical protein